MPQLMDAILARAQGLGVPLSAHLDVTSRCNERCVHCYVEPNGDGELSTGEVRGILEQLAEAGTLFLSISGGEPLMRKDLFEILEAARGLSFDVKLKTNGLLIGPEQARRLRALRVNEVQVSLYSHRAEAHDRVTGVRGSLKRTLRAIRLMRELGQKVIISHIVMRGVEGDHPAVKALAAELGAGFRIDPTITPRPIGNYSSVVLNVPRRELLGIVQSPEYVNSVEEDCAPPTPADAQTLEGAGCSAGFTHCYIAPDGDVYPCVQFPLLCGNLRQRSFAEIWRDSPQLKEVRALRNLDLPVCSECSHLSMCSRCPGLALMEGDLRGPSVADCEKSYARTGMAPSGRPALAKGRFRYWKEWKMAPEVELKNRLAADVLRSSGELRLRLTGTSMLPAIWPGEELLIRRDGAAEAGPGDVILFEREGRLFAHRVVRRMEGADGPVWITRGDRHRHDDPPVSSGELLGRVEGVPRLTAMRRAAAWVLRRSWLVTRVALRLRRLG
jgi:radical SAM protein with 4Fe4S-binding SPASM domain